ncbi:glycerophosphodiester phosphodiesterase [Nocardioides sp. CBS4Y-1]|uniref:Glycerophosphodiester phosphodiesterase n=1 Tax=Nocardioides acrostichi TaxID=2784339 RepID=A0A930Y665_9ACTN|nr:glycerophosphodiester phosphodiesterase [Nocardioides acrostichi]
MIAFAHRGGALHPDLIGMENTERAFAHAVSLGYGYLETDVHLTRDGVLMAFHDAVLDRVTDGTGAIADLTREQVQHARVAGREEIPTLAQLMCRWPEERFNIDLKSADAAEPLAALLDEAGATDRVLVGSFSPRRLAAFRRACGPRVLTSAHPLEVLAFLLLPAAIAGRITRRRVAALQVPHTRSLALGPLRFTVPVVTRALVRRAHAAGVHVHVWTIDDPEEMEQLLDLGVDGIFTDRTDVLKGVLVRRGLWEGAGR